MGPLGWQETIFIFVFALLIFGPKKLPELGKTIGKAMTEFRRASSELRSTWDREMAAMERETESLKSETNKVENELTTSYYDGTSNYGSSYDSGYEYGYDSGTTASSTSETGTSTVGESATQVAEQTAPATAAGGESQTATTLAEAEPPSGGSSALPDAGNGAAKG